MTKKELLEKIEIYKITSKPTTVKEHDIVEFQGKIGTIDNIYFSDSKLEWSIKIFKGRNKTGYTLGDWKGWGQCTTVTDETVLTKVNNPCNIQYAQELQDRYIETDSISEREDLENLIKKELDKCPHSWENKSGWNRNKHVCRYCNCVIEDDMFSYDFET
jgi:hypothetical protein